MSICNGILDNMIRRNEFEMTRIEHLLIEQDMYTSREKAMELDKVISNFTNSNYHLADILADLKNLSRKWMLGE